MPPTSPRRVALKVLIVSVVAAALIGCVALLQPEIEKTALRTLLTSLTVSACSLIAMACLAAMERGRIRPVPAVGGVLAVATGALTIVAIWADSHDHTWWKVIWTAWVATLATAHASFLAYPDLAPRHAWVRRATWVLALVVAAMCCYPVWADEDPGETYARVLGIFGILMAAGTILVPVLARMAAPDRPVPAPGGCPWLRFCPSCGQPVTGRDGAATCLACGAASRVTFGP